MPEIMVFGTTAAEEHANIQAAIKESSTSIHAAGAHLAYFREKQLFRELPGSYSDFPDYIIRGLGIAVSTAYQYIDAAYFPAWVVERHGVDKTAELRKLVALTAADETPEQAVALQIPLKDGTTKPFEAATADEVRQARKLIKAGEGKAVRPSNGGDEKLREAARLLEAEVESATQEWIKPNQILARVAKGKLLIDVKGVPRDQARAIFDAISAAMED